MVCDRYKARLIGVAGSLALIGLPRGKRVQDGDEVYHLLFSPDGKRLASASAERWARLWDPKPAVRLKPCWGIGI